MPKLSIITPCFNSESYISSYLDHLEELSSLDLEVIFMDGKSNDGTLAEIKKRQNKIKFLRVISEPDKGVYDAMNKGIEKANSEWLYFMGVDDKFLGGIELINILDNSKSDIVYGDVLRNNQRYDGEFSLQKLVSKNICHQAMCFNKRVFKELGIYDLKYKILSDYEFNIRAFANSKLKRSYVGIVIGNYGTEGMSSSLVEEQFFLDMPKIYKDYGAVNIDLSDNYDYIGKLGLQRVYDGFKVKGLRMIWKSILNGGDKKRLRSAFSHIRRNLFRRKKPSI